MSELPVAISKTPTRQSASAIRNIASQIAVEPIILLTFTALFAKSVVMQNMLQEHICRSFYNGTVPQCEDYVVSFTNRTDTVKGIQATTSNYNLYAESIGTLPAVVWLALFGPWSDRHGRKLIILVPIAGATVTSLALLLLVLLECVHPQYVLLASVPVGLTGGRVLIQMACFSYLGDITDEKDLTFRMAILNGMITVGMPIGILLGGQLYAALGYGAVYAVSAMLYALTFVYTVIRISNKSPMSNMDVQSDVAATDYGRKCKDIFNTDSVLGNFRTCFQKRDGHLRALILILLTCELLLAFPNLGETDVLYLYSRKQYNWDIVSYTYYQTFYIAAASIGLFAVLPIMSVVLKFQDSMLGLIGNSAHALNGIMKVFSYTGTILWIGASTAIVASISLIMNKAMLSKCVSKSELGKIFAVDGILMAAAPTFTGLAYTQLYNVTMITFPSAIFVISATCSLITTIFFGFIYYVSRKSPEQLVQK